MSQAYDNQLATALEIAKNAHQGQIRKFGQDIGKPYFDTHIIRVVNRVPPWARAVAALHDVIEDTGECEETLRAWGEEDGLEPLEPWIISSVLLLTRREELSYGSYIHSIVRANGLDGAAARLVKMADLMDNMSTDPSSFLSTRYVPALAAVSERIREDYETGWTMTYETGVV